MRDCELIDEEYPMLRCVVHPDRPARPGYAVCSHVMQGAEAVVHVAPTASELGHIVCGHCADTELTGDVMLLAQLAGALELRCAYCVEYHLGARLPAAEAVDLGATVQ